MPTIHDLIPDAATYLPEGEKDGVKIERFTMTRDNAETFNLQLAFAGQSYRRVEPGTYTRLLMPGVGLMMSDTHAEKRDHLDAVRKATGDCLVTGLGIGMVANAMAMKPEVTRVTVIELNPALIELVAPHLPEKVKIIQADALTYRPSKGERYAVAWHDIWPSISLDNCDDITTLKRRWCRRVDWQSVWGWPEIMRQKRENTRSWW